MANYCTYSDGELIMFLQKSDEKAFTELYNRYWDKLYTAALMRIDNEADAEEIVQTVFIKLWERRKALRLRFSLYTYLAAAIKYEVLNILASRRKQQFYMQQPEISPDLCENYTQNQVDFHELQEQLALLVDALPEKCRVVFLLSREEGYSQKQIAAELGIAEKTVEGHLALALRKLKMGLPETSLLVAIFLS